MDENRHAVITRRLRSRVAYVLLFFSFMANGVLLISWAASRVDEYGKVYFMNHGRKVFLPLPPLERAPVLFGILGLLFMIQWGILGWHALNRYFRRNF